MKKTKYIFGIVTFILSFGCALMVTNSVFGNILFGTKKASAENVLDKIQDGDLIFQTSESKQCEAIRVATKSKFSHCGIVFFKNGEKYVFEAVQPVKLTPIKNWIERGNGSNFLVTRLKGASTLLHSETLLKMKEYAMKFNNKDYDLHFGWSDDRIYCSELVWKIYKNGAGIELCPLQKLKNFELKDPRVQTILSQRYGTKIPLEEDVVAPSDLVKSKITTTIIDTY